MRVTRIFWHLYRLGITMHPEDAVRYELYAQNAFVLCDTVEEAIELSRELLRNNKHSFYCISRLVEALLYPNKAEWPKDKGAAEKIARYLEELAHNDNLRTRLFAEWASTLLYSQYLSDFHESRKHFEISIDLNKKLDLLVQNGTDSQIVNIILNSRFSANTQEDTALNPGTRYLFAEIHAINSMSY
jgi:hypothetical protein